MLDQTRGSDYAIWLVAALLYAGDAARLLAPREILLVEAGRGRLAAALAENPFTLFGRVLAFPPLHRPHRGTFVAAWGRAWIDRPALDAVTRSLERFRAALLVPRILAACGFALLFGLGPLLTLLLGPNAAVVFTAMLLYPTAAAAVAWLWWRRRRLSLTRAHSAWLTFEVLICPAFLPNLVRKLAVAHPISADGAQLLLATAAPDARSLTLARLATRAEEALEEAGPGSGEGETLRAYLGRLRDVS